MGDKEMLIEVVEKARGEMKDAQDVATRTQRPIDACPSHDALFALTRAQTNALDTLLMLKQEEMREGVKVAPAEDGSTITGPMGFSIKGPIARLTIAALFILGVVYLMLMRQDANMRKDFSETIVPAVAKVIAAQKLEKATN